MSLWRNIQNRMKPREVLVLGFAALILLGALLLMLPCATMSGEGLDFLSALFTATSAVCVTGLTVVNTGLTFTVFGKIVILCLIQVGGLGLMTVASLLFLMVGKRISLRERLVIQESFNTDSLQGLLRLVRGAILVTGSCELIGALLLMIRFVPQFGWSRGCFHAVFTAVSAFCNAGFDLFGQANSIECLATDPFVLCVLMALIVLGGLGFAVILDVLQYRKTRRLMLHTRLVLIVSAVLLAVGAGLTALLEWNNPLTLGQAGFETGDKLVNALFQSVTLRTAGFDTFGQGDLTAASVLLGIMLMFIGASPASTGGGAKTTTVFAVLLLIWSVVRRRQDHNVGKRRLSETLMKKALAVFALMLVLLLCGTVIICAAEQMSGNALTLSQVLYETVSASATVGLSTGITAGLHGVSKVVLILLMFFGRLGPLTISMALSGEASKVNALRYPEDHIMIG